MINKDISYTDLKEYLFSKSLFTWEKLSAAQRRELMYFYYKDHVNELDVYDPITESTDPKEFKSSIVSLMFDKSSKLYESVVKRAVMRLYLPFVEEDFDQSAADFIEGNQELCAKPDYLASMIINL